jgi:L-seryl-tRNA(Ser) seleniumtransferase
VKLFRLPSVDAVLGAPEGAALIARFGRTATLNAVRTVLAKLRAEQQGAAVVAVVDAAADALAVQFAPSQRPVFNLTGTVLHTNLGRAPLPPAAAEAAAAAMRAATTLEFDLARGQRGERDDHVRGLLRKLTGAEDATVVNNNAAAVLLVLNTLALGQEVIVSRGELIEIGASFRIPEIMVRAGAVLREVGTTNRTHARDFTAALGPEISAIMRVHPSNYAIVGFTAGVTRAELARIAHEAEVTFVEDLGSGSLADLSLWGLPHEPTPQEALAEGADVVTFSGDKLLGGPQAGLIVGKQTVIARLNANPLKRTLRLDKGRLAALEHVLRLYLDPDRLAERLPALRLLTRPAEAIREAAEQVAGAVAVILPGATVEVEPCRSQVGSGALPLDLLTSWAVTIRCCGLDALAARLRTLPIPVIGRAVEGRLWLDCRCLEDGDVPVLLDQLRAAETHTDRGEVDTASRRLVI